MNDHALELHKSVEHIEINDDIILPNMDLLYENLAKAIDSLSNWSLIITFNLVMKIS
jgi:hypothetical protein